MSSAPPGIYRWAQAAAAAVLLTLVACASTPRREYPPTAPPTAPPAASPASAADAVPDARPRAEPRSTHGNPQFYDVNGRRYQVLASAESYVERGVASWYGPDFHGHNTSSGEPYDMYAMTAAHKTLPLPCYARITNLSNGRSIVVRINDRGPFVGNRIVDLSYTAALKLDVVRTGTALVELRVVGPAMDSVAPPAPAVAALPPAPPAAAAAMATPAAGSATAGPALYIQIGAYADAGNARRVIAQLQVAGIAPQMHGQNGAGARRNHGCDRVRIQRERARVEVGENGHGSLIQNGNSRSHVCDGRKDHLVAG